MAVQYSEIMVETLEIVKTLDRYLLTAQTTGGNWRKQGKLNPAFYPEPNACYPNVVIEQSTDRSVLEASMKECKRIGVNSGLCVVEHAEMFELIYA